MFVKLTLLRYRNAWIWGTFGRWDDADKHGRSCAAGVKLSKQQQQLTLRRPAVTRATAARVSPFTVEHIQNEFLQVCKTEDLQSLTGFCDSVSWHQNIQVPPIQPVKRSLSFSLLPVTFRGSVGGFFFSLCEFRNVIRSFFTAVHSPFVIMQLNVVHVKRSLQKSYVAQVSVMLSNVLHFGPLGAI